MLFAALLAGAALQKHARSLPAAGPSTPYGKTDRAPTITCVRHQREKSKTDLQLRNLG